MKFFQNIHKNFKFPKSSAVAILVTLSILIYGDYWTTTLDFQNVFSIELLEEKSFSNELVLPDFSIKKISSSYPLLKLPFFSKNICSHFYIQKSLLKIQYQFVGKEILTFDKPMFISENGNSSNRSDLPDF